ncbi:MAG: ArsR/SmtB family transcription factor [bacterium]
MEINSALRVFATLSQETRLKAFRHLVKAGPAGLAAGTLSDALAIPHNTLSFHLNHLANAGLVESTRQGRSIIYTANFDITRDFISFLVKDCCSSDMATIREDSSRGCSVIELADFCQGKSI